MKHFTKFAVAAAAALSLSAIAAPSEAATLLTFATTGATATDAVKWTNAGNTFNTVGTPTVSFNFVLPQELTGVLATFSLTSSAPGAVVVNGNYYEQPNLAGSFEFRAVNDFDYQSVHYSAGSLILGATFNGGLLRVKSTGGTGSVEDDNLTGNILTYTSDVAGFAHYTYDAFSFGLTPARAPSKDASGQLKDFTAGIGGTFSGAVPEPATWGLMIMGFGGAGAMLRRRRSAAAAA